MLRPVRIAFIAAIVLGFVALLVALSNHSSIIGALVWVAAAVGLWRGNVWCAFGPALWLAAQVWSVLVIAVGDWEAVKENDELLENMIGKPLIIYWSYDAPTDQLQSSSIGLDHVVDLAQNFFFKTRWERTLKLVRGYPIP